METVKLLILSLLCLSANGLPGQISSSRSEPPVSRNTIFADERFEGQIFEKVDAFENIELTARNGDPSSYRLPNTTYPGHYKIFWKIDLSNQPFTQSGEVEIEIYARRSLVREIVLHSHELTLGNITLTRNDNSYAIEVEQDDKNQLLKIRLLSGSLSYSAVSAQKHTLKIKFEGQLRDDMYGIYKNWYTDGGEVRWMASTQFQATAARWAFPCYDEPSYKATFDVTIRRHEDFNSWFCTDRYNSTVVTEDPNWTDDLYYTTPKMSTYLLALIVANYESIELDYTPQLKHEVIARYDAIKNGQGDYAKELGLQLLNKMDSLTRYNFEEHGSNLSMTQAAIPDFGAGAMENWGLLTYRESYLMYDENDTNKHFQQIIAYILSHEIAHQWYGNLVTCDWWDNLWLNEGFASYYEYFLTDEVDKSLGFSKRYTVEHVHSALLADAANNPHALTNQASVNSNAAISAMFSIISYNKGGAFLRMTEHLLGTAAFQTGLANYLVERQFDTALPIHLFKNLETAGLAAGVLDYGSGFSFIDYAKSWTEQAGHPVLNVQVNRRTGQMIINQRRFNINTGYSATGNNYIVPITFATSSRPDFSNTKPTDIISHAVTVINGGPVNQEWVIFNVQQSGFYRVNYDSYTWDLISLALKNNIEDIPELNRAQIVNDVFQFARSGIMNYTHAFSILSFLENETAYAPWIAAIGGFNWLRTRLNNGVTAEVLINLDSTISRWIEKLMDKLTFEEIPNEDFLDRYQRLQVAPFLCNMGNDTCMETAKNKFADFRNNETLNPVPVDSRNWVYCNGLRQGGDEDFEFLWKRFLNHNVYTEKILILQNLGCTRHTGSLQKFMTEIVRDTLVIRKQDYTTAFNSAVSGNEENTEVAFKFIDDNMDLVASAFGNSVATPMSYVIARFRTESRINEFITWAGQNRERLGNSTYNSCINNAESTRASITWATETQNDISNYLQTPPPAPVTTTEAPFIPPAISITPQPPLSEPVTPFLPTTPSSATTSFLAATPILFALIFRTIF